MIDLATIAAEYPPAERGFTRNIVREYLQYKILQSIFESEYASQLSFLGGTALRIIHGSQRFSEDLDFDNFGINTTTFNLLTKQVQHDLAREGYAVEIRNVFKGAYRCYVRIPRLLYDHGLSPHKDEKVMIQLDTMAQKFSYTPDPVILNKFEVFTRVNVTPLPILLSQKIGAALERKTAKGRDFYDIVFLFSKTKPDYNYLRDKTGINNPEELKKRLLERCETIDLQALIKDVRAFLINSKDTQKISLFKDYISQIIEG